MLDAIAPSRTHAEAAGFVPAYPCAAPVPSVAFGAHAHIAPALNESTRLAFFPIGPDRMLLAISAPGTETIVHLSLATMRGLAAVAAAIVALCQVEDASAAVSIRRAPRC